MAPAKVVEVRYDHFGDGRFRHGCTFLRLREDKLPKDCLLDQVIEQQAAIQNINAFIEAGLATAGSRTTTSRTGMSMSLSTGSIRSMAGPHR